MKCHRCHGTGVEPDWKKLGWQVRCERVRRGLTLTTMAKRLGVSKAHLSDMELGRRSWQGPTGRRYLKRFGIATHPGAGT